MWRCWGGLQCQLQHGTYLFGLVFGFLALALQGLFFSVPLTGISISLARYVAGIALSRVSIMRS